jgi:hypothetical protein
MCVACGTSSAVTSTGLCRVCASEVADERRVEELSKRLHDPLEHYRTPPILGVDVDTPPTGAGHDVVRESGERVPAFDPRVLHTPTVERDLGETRQKTVETRQRMRQAPRHQKHMPRTKKAAR